jgi:hypothetical protein
MSSAGRYPERKALLAEAHQAAGLSNFGPGDFREGMDVLLESLARDAELDASTDAEVLGTFKRRLVNRLEVEAWYRAHPKIEQLEVKGPIDICGLPRTGTTALANMMSLDPQFRSLRGWEQAKPCPPPTTAGEASDPRRTEAAKQMELLSPEMKAMHLFDLDATMEDTDLLGMCFHGQGYTQPVWGYHAWWRGADMKPTYAYHRRVVKLLQSQRPPNLWLFKAPHHKFHLEAIVSAYPDARFVMTHRDPAKAIPSYASLVSSLFPKSARGEHDLKKVGREVSEHLRIGMKNAIAARKRLGAQFGEQRFFDVQQREIDADALGTVQRVYDFLGLELSAQMKTELQAWVNKNRSGTHGTHRYTPEQFGLSKVQLRSDYAFYIKHFDVPLEG